MKTRFFALLTAALLLLTPFAVMEVGEQALDTVSLLSRGEFQAVFDHSTPQMQEALVSPEGFGQLWDELEALGGAFRGTGEINRSEQAEYVVFTVETEFERSVLTMNVVFNQEGLLAGLSVSAVKPQDAAAAFEGEIVPLREGQEDETQARLLLPEGAGPFPAVILVHGSGPSDMNEAVFGMTPFLDLARGLKKRGIASLRYDKYTFAHAALLQKQPEQLASFTIHEEYVQDASEAVERLLGDERIASVFLLGHSQGAYVVPRAAKKLNPGDVSGMILLSGSPLSITDIIYRQNLDAIAAANLPEEAEKQQMAKLQEEAAKVAKLDGMTEEELKAFSIYGSMSGWYIKDEMDWAPAPPLMDMPEVPVLVVQGGKDFQVTREEGIRAWQSALKERENTQYLHLPNMTHLLFDLEGPSAGIASDYAVPTPVSETLIDALSAWVLSQTTRSQ